MDFKDIVFSKMRPESNNKDAIIHIASSVLNNIKNKIIHEAQQNIVQSTFMYNGYLITDDYRFISQFEQMARKNHYVMQIQPTEYAELFRQTLVSLAAKEGIIIGNYVAIPSRGSDDNYYYGAGVYSSPRFIIDKQSNRNGCCYKLPLVKDWTSGNFFVNKKCIISNVDGKFISNSNHDLFLALPISFKAVR